MLLGGLVKRQGGGGGRRWRNSHVNEFEICIPATANRIFYCCHKGWWWWSSPYPAIMIISGSSWWRSWSPHLFLFLWQFSVLGSRLGMKWNGLAWPGHREWNGMEWGWGGCLDPPSTFSRECVGPENDLYGLGGPGWTGARLMVMVMGAESKLHAHHSHEAHSSGIGIIFFEMRGRRCRRHGQD